MATPGSVIRLSILKGGLIAVKVDPPDLNTYLELGKLPSRGERQKQFYVSFWDLPGVQAIASLSGHRVEPDYEVRKMMDKWTEWCLDLEWTKSFAPVNDFSVPGLDIKFLMFQARGVNYLVKIMTALLGDMMGLGKSIETLGALFTWRAMGGGKLPTLILGPTSVVGDWAKKFRDFASMKIGVADQSEKKKRIALYESRPEFLAMSYDIFMRDLVDVTRFFHPKALVVDECQRMTNRKSIITKKLFEYVDIVNPIYRIPISGSPISNEPQDLWAILRLIDPGLAGSATRFEGRYIKKEPVWIKKGGKSMLLKKEYGFGKNKKEFVITKVSGYQNLDELKMKLAPYMIRRLKSEVAAELPEKTFEEISIILSKEERRIYDDLQAQFSEAMAEVDEGEDGKTGATFFSWFLRAQQICSSLEILDLGDKSAKIKELKDFVKDFAVDQKILIFSRFKAMTKIVCRELKEYKPIHLNGDVPQKDRQGMVDLFQEKPDNRLFVSTLKAGGVGLTLTAASIVVRLDRWFSPSANEQAVDRTHRIGQKNPVTVVDFIVRDSVEERILEIIQRKKKMISSLMTDEQVIKKIKKSEMLKLI